MTPLTIKGLRISRRGGMPGEGGDLSLQKLGLLREADVFRDLSDEQMHQVEEMTVMTGCPTGRVIYAPGETGEVLFILKKGKVQLYRLGPDGKKLLINTIGPGTLFGDMPFTGHRMLESYAEAVEESLLCVMSREDIEELIRAYPTVGIRLIGTLAERLGEVEARLEESTLMHISARVAAALTRLTEQQGPVLAVTHQELADIIGTHRETVTRALGEFQEKALIELSRGKIKVSDPARLRSLASGWDATERS